MRQLSLSLFAASTTVGLLGCPAEKPAPPPAPAPTPVAKPASSPLCVGKPSDGPEEKIEIAGKMFTKRGSTLTQDVADADDEFIIGQVSDIKDHTPENAANLQVAFEWMKAEKADAIALTGDLGETAASVQKVVEDAAATGLPVLVIVGNRECASHFDEGVKAAQGKFKNIINLNQTRVVNFDDLSLVSMPGYFNKSYIHCADGCEYTVDDVRALPEIAKAATQPVKLLVSHGPPLQAGPQAIDRIHEGANVGDPNLTEVLKGGTFQFGMFGNIQEAGGYATNLAGDARVAAETFVDTFFFNPGPIDSVRWVMLDGSESVGMAGLVHVKGKQARYKVKRMKAGEAKVATPPSATK
jgi:Icc-related predicted phosphoesterase